MIFIIGAVCISFWPLSRRLRRYGSPHLVFILESPQKNSYLELILIDKNIHIFLNKLLYYFQEINFNF